MLPNTTILPESDARLAAQLVAQAIAKLDVILMIVFGKDELAAQVVEWADRLANRLPTTSGSISRRVVWVRFNGRDATPKAVRDELDRFMPDGPYPLVAVLNFHDALKSVMTRGDEVRPLTLERLFLKGHEI